MQKNKYEDGLIGRALWANSMPFCCFYMRMYSSN